MHIPMPSSTYRPASTTAGMPTQWEYLGFAGVPSADGAVMGAAFAAGVWESDSTSVLTSTAET